MHGTNPLTFGVPTGEDFPFVIDCATSLTQRGKIEVYDRAGKELPVGWVIDRTGKPRTDTRWILDDLIQGTAALTPFGGIGEEAAGCKGYSYSTVVELLSKERLTRSGQCKAPRKNEGYDRRTWPYTEQVSVVMEKGNGICGRLLL